MFGTTPGGMKLVCHDTLALSGAAEDLNREKEKINRGGPPNDTDTLGYMVILITYNLCVNSAFRHLKYE